MDNNIGIETHFSLIADKYKELRTTDQEPIEYIINHLPSKKDLEIMDLGCGTGRYDLLLLDELDETCWLTGLDANEAMLNHFNQNMKSNGYSQIRSICAPIEELENHEMEKYDVVLSFNALHHFNLITLMDRISKILKPNGTAFIYSRTRIQNQRSIWGRYFPKFHYYENRLNSLTEVEEVTYETKGIELKEITLFKFYRSDQLDKLIDEASNHHYSTFSLYSPEELDVAMSDFEEIIENKFNNINKIEWIARNVMFRIQKSKFE